MLRRPDIGALGATFESKVPAVLGVLGILGVPVVPGAPEPPDRDLRPPGAAPSESAILMLIFVRGPFVQGHMSDKVTRPNP